MIELSHILFYTLDYLFSYMYISYWNKIYSYRFSLFSQRFNSFDIRRKTINGDYIFSLVFYDRPYEFIGNKEGIIKIYGISQKYSYIYFEKKYIYGDNLIKLKSKFI
jgi:hypothetical protein